MVLIQTLLGLILDTVFSTPVFVSKAHGRLEAIGILTT